MRRLVLLCGLLPPVALLAGCGAGSSAARSVAAGDVVPASAAASVQGREYRFVLPSGGLTVTVSDPVASIDAGQTQAYQGLRAPAGTSLRGLLWRLDPAAGYANVPNYHLLYDLKDVFGDAQPAELRLVAGGRTIDVGSAAPDADGDGVAAPAGSWAAVPSGTAVLEVVYDGMVQKAELDTGTIEPGAAAPLYRPQPAPSGGLCRSSRAWLNCFNLEVASYPYLGGRGWAPPGHTWAVVRFGTQPAADLGRVTVGGVLPAREVDTIEHAWAYEIPLRPRRLPLGGTATSGSRTAALSGWVAGAAR